MSADTTTTTTITPSMSTLSISSPKRKLSDASDVRVEESVAKVPKTLEERVQEIAEWNEAFATDLARMYVMHGIEVPSTLQAIVKVPIAPAFFAIQKPKPKDDSCSDDDTDELEKPSDDEVSDEEDKAKETTDEEKAKDSKEWDEIVAVRVRLVESPASVAARAKAEAEKNQGDSIMKMEVGTVSETATTTDSVLKDS